MITPKLITKYRYPISAILILALVGWWYFHTKVNQTPTRQTVTVERGTIVSSLNLSGTVVSANQVSISTQATGIVDQVFINDSDGVKSGQKIATLILDSTGHANQAQAYAAYLNAQKNLASVTASGLTNQAAMFTAWDKYKTLAESDLYADPNNDTRNLPEFQVSQKQWLAAETTYKTQALSLSAAQANLNEAWNNYRTYSSTIYSPSSGIVRGVNIAPGLVIGSSTNPTTIITLQTSGLPIISASASEVDINHLQVNQAVIISSDNFSDLSLTGKIVSLDRVGTVTNSVTQYPILIQLDTDTELLLTNMVVSANIILDKHVDALILPSQAIVATSELNQGQVTLIQNDQPSQITITTGLTSATDTEILTGLNEGDEVLLTQTTTQTSTNSRPSSENFGFGGGGMMFRSR